LQTEKQRSKEEGEKKPKAAVFLNVCRMSLGETEPKLNGKETPKDHVQLRGEHELGAEPRKRAKKLGAFDLRKEANFTLHFVPLSWHRGIDYYRIVRFAGLLGAEMWSREARL
jgi:hypothetical protein